ncbi:MAG: FesM [Thermomicrobiales bacterium]
MPVVGRLLNWKHARTVIQIPMLLIAGLIIIDGFIGPSSAPENFAGVIPWVHWRGFVVLALLIFGNLFCMGCPFMLVRRPAKWWLPGRWNWPAWLPGKWLAIVLLVAFFWAYEAFDLWASPWLTAWVAVAYFAGAFLVDGFFKGAAFCKHVCPIGQFHFVNSMASPFEVKVRDTSTCESCRTKDCITGRRDSASGAIVQSGCELYLFQQRKHGNLDCTFCLDCIQACPYDNVGIIARNPLDEYRRDRNRSGIGRLSERPDFAMLALVLVFGSLLNAFGMVGPVFRFERWLAGVLGLQSEPAVLGVVFLVGLIVIPALLVSYTAWASRALTRADRPLLPIISRFSFGLVPIGFAMWLAHYGFHFFTGALTIVPVSQQFLMDIGIDLFGQPRRDLAELLPISVIDSIEMVVLQLGLLMTLVALYRISRDEFGRSRAVRGAIPWAILTLLIFAASLWLMSQPMEMRGTFLS